METTKCPIWVPTTFGVRKIEATLRITTGRKFHYDQVCFKKSLPDEISFSLEATMPKAYQIKLHYYNSIPDKFNVTEYQA